MSQARGIQYDTVAAVADKLVAAGVKADQISAIMIREETRTGSLTTIINHLRQWKIHSTKAIVPANFTSDDMAAILMVMTNKVQEAANRVRDEERAAHEVKLVEMESLRDQLHSTIQLNSEIEAERADAADKLEIYRKELYEIRLREATLKGELTALKQALARFEPTAPAWAHGSPDDRSNENSGYQEKAGAPSPHQAAVSRELGSVVAKVVGEAIQRNGDDPQKEPS